MSRLLNLWFEIPASVVVWGFLLLPYAVLIFYPKFFVSCTFTLGKMCAGMAILVGLIIGIIGALFAINVITTLRNKWRTL